jgi:hypothetical protein
VKASSLCEEREPLGLSEKQLLGRMGMILFLAGFALAQDGMSIHHLPF